MNENQLTNNSQNVTKNISAEEKKNYCLAWKKSGMKQLDFCKVNGIAKSTLYQWLKKLKEEEREGGFSPLVSEKFAPKKQVEEIALTICFLNQIQLKLAIPEHRVVPFIQELGYATTVIR